MKLKQTALTIALMLGMSTLVVPATIAYAAPAKDKSIDCSVLPDSICKNAKEGDLEKSGVWLLLIMVINILTAGIGFVAVAVIAYAGFLYTTAQDSSEQTKQAKEMIRNVVVGLIVYALMYSFIQWLIPGGIFYA